MLANMKIGVKLLVGFLFIAALSIVIGVIGISNASNINNMAGTMHSRDMLGLSSIKEVNIDLMAVGRARNNLLLAASPEEKQKQVDMIEKYSASLNGWLEKAKPDFVLPRAKELMAAFERNWGEYEHDTQQFLVAARDKQINGDVVKQMHSDAKSAELEATLTDLSRVKEGLAKAAAEETVSIYESGRIMMLSAMAIAMLMGVAFAVMITRGIKRQLGGEPEHAAEIARKLAAGDVTADIPLYAGDSNSVMAAMKVMAFSIQNLQKELQRLTQASREGQLSERGRPEQFQGAYADIVGDTNAMLDAILLPIGEGNRILRLIRGGNLREKIEISCKGDHDAMKNSVNGVHAWLTSLIAYVTKIANGDLTAVMEKASADDQIHVQLGGAGRNG